MPFADWAKNRRSARGQALLPPEQARSDDPDRGRQPLSPYAHLEVNEGGFRRRLDSIADRATDARQRIGSSIALKWVEVRRLPTKHTMVTSPVLSSELLRRAQELEKKPTDKSNGRWIEFTETELQKLGLPDINLDSCVAAGPLGSVRYFMPLASLIVRLRTLWWNKLGSCHPHTFRVPAEDGRKGLAHHGHITFGEHVEPRRSAAANHCLSASTARENVSKAKYLHLEECGFDLPRNTAYAGEPRAVAPLNAPLPGRGVELRKVLKLVREATDFKAEFHAAVRAIEAGKKLERRQASEAVYIERIMQMMELHWKMQRPSVLISVAGGAADFKVTNNLYKDLYEVTKAAETGAAWVVTGGTDAGVMAALGRMSSAVSVEAGSSKQSCWIGVVPWGGVRGADLILQKEAEQKPRKKHDHASQPTPRKKHEPACAEAPRHAGLERRAPNVDARGHTASYEGGNGGAAVGRPAMVSTVSSASVASKEGAACGEGLPERIDVHYHLKSTRTGGAQQTIGGDKRGAAVDDLEQANLEPNHTHFLLVDNGVRGKEAWGSEVDLRFALEEALCVKRGVPRVMLVVEGGFGTLYTVWKAVRQNCPVVLIANSGGAATVIWM